MYELYKAFDKEVLRLIYGGGFLSKSEQGNLNQMIKQNRKKCQTNHQKIVSE